LITYRGMPDVPAELLRYLTRLLALVLTQFEHKYIG